MLRRLTVPLLAATVLVLAQLAYALTGGLGPVASHDPVAQAAQAEEVAKVAAARSAGAPAPIGAPPSSNVAAATGAAAGRASTDAPRVEGDVFTCGRASGPAADHPTNTHGATLLGSNPGTYCPVLANTPISQEYGTKSDTSPYGHSGMDFNGDTGDPVFSVSEGEVVYSTFNDGGYGNLIGIKRPDGVLFWYAHLSKRIARYGAWVNAGDRIGLMGNTGASQGSHLHFEVAVGKGRGGAYGTPTDPRDLLFGKPAGTRIGWATSAPKWACDHYGGC